MVKVFFQVLKDDIKAQFQGWLLMAAILGIGYFFATSFWTLQNWSQSDKLHVLLIGVACMALGGFMLGLTLIKSVVPDTWLIWRAKQKAPLQFL